MRWLISPAFDLTWLHLPVWFCWALALLLPRETVAAPLPVWVWVVAVLIIDVGHVWTTIYRTYLDPVARREQGRRLPWTPLLCFALCLPAALISETLFWRLLAYVAVFHFIKQQVGIAALHGRAQGKAGDRAPLPWAWRLDKYTVYVGAGFPILYWHTRPEKGISWFVSGDFVPLSAAWLPSWANVLFVAVWVGLPAAWLATNLVWTLQGRQSFPLGKALWVLGTCINWWLGIVAFDSDLVFTITNVVAHGVPYYALVGRYARRKAAAGGYGKRVHAAARGPLLTLAALALVLGLAFAESMLWDGLLYRDYTSVFTPLGGSFLPFLEDPWARGLCIALLSLPQTTHYVLDGFIWKFNAQNPDLGVYLMDG